MPRGQDSRFHHNRQVGKQRYSGPPSTFVDRQLSGFDKFKSPGGADHPSYQIPEGELGHPGDVKGAPRRKGTGNILIDPISNTWSNTPQ